jgi:hypothetical protein
MSSLLKSLDTLTAYVIGVLIVWAVIFAVCWRQPLTRRQAFRPHRYADQYKERSATHELDPRHATRLPVLLPARKASSPR